MTESQYLTAVYAFSPLGPVRIKLLLSYFGSAKKIWGASVTDLIKTGLKPYLVNNFSTHRKKFDIQKYFENVDHNILLKIIKNKIADKRIIWLIRKILANSSSQTKGMPLGNLTSQFFANVYLNELDWFVKTKLKAKYYIRYVDDFVIFGRGKGHLEFYKEEINMFLKNKLKIQLHPDKSKILILGNCVNFLGFRVFFYHKLLKKSNIRKMKRKLKSLAQEYKLHEIDYDSIYDSLEGWIAYMKNANSYKLRRKITAEFSKYFANEISTKEIKRYLKIMKKASSASHDKH